MPLYMPLTPLAPSAGQAGLLSCYRPLEAAMEIPRKVRVAIYNPLTQESASISHHGESDKVIFQSLYTFTR